MSGNSNRNGVRNKKKKDEKKIEHDKKQTNHLRTASTIVVIFYAICFLFLSSFNLPEPLNAALSYLLAYFSLWTTLCFELNEWRIKLNFKFKSSILDGLFKLINKIPTYPAIFGVLILVFQVSLKTLFKSTNYDSSNFVCSLTIVLYIGSMHFRTSDAK